MNDNDSIKLLFQYACNHKFEEFDSLFSEMEGRLPFDNFWEAYLMRAQIKLYATVPTALDDIIKAERACAAPQFPPLKSIWKSDTLNRFIVFPHAPGALKTFLDSLSLIGKKMAVWYGEQGHILVQQLQGEILYFMGETEKALAFADELLASKSINHMETAWSLIVKFRCNLDLLQPKKAEQNMFDIIRCAKAYPDCTKIYEAFRIWANFTTGWSGDSPRYHEDENGKMQPSLIDRIEGVKLGTAYDTQFELPFVEYAKRNYDSSYTIRNHYMSILHAMYWLSVGDYKQAETYFGQFYETSQNSGIAMSIIESGTQVIPLLKYAKDKNLNCSLSWLDTMTIRAERYEEGLRLYRSGDE